MKFQARITRQGPEGTAYDPRYGADPVRSMRPEAEAEVLKKNGHNIQLFLKNP